MTIQEIFEKWATYDYTNYDGSDVKTMSEPEFQLAVVELLKAQREACMIAVVHYFEGNQMPLYTTKTDFLMEAILNAKVSHE